VLTWSTHLLTEYFTAVNEVEDEGPATSWRIRGSPTA